MDSLQEKLTFWATIVGTVLGIVGFLESHNWLTLTGAVILLGALGILFYADYQRRRLRTASVTIEGRSIDCLNVASLNRRMNKTLWLQSVAEVTTIDGADAKMSWDCSGYCRAAQEGAVLFSIDSDNNVPFDALACYAYDLIGDPERNHRIRPILVGADGLSRKVAAPFLSPVTSKQPFHVVLHCTLPGCMTAGVDYITSTASFDQDEVQRSEVRLIFKGQRPDWVRVYERLASGSTRLLKDLKPTRREESEIEYTDIAERVKTASVRIYVFKRS